MTKDSDTLINETIVLIARETGWTLEYIRSLKLSEVNQLIKEIRYQRSVEEWKMMRAVALAVASWASSQQKGRRYRPEDFCGECPKRD